MNKKPLFLLGGGGHGRVLIDALESCGHSIEGILDVGLQAGAEVFGIPVVGGDEQLDRLDPGAVLLVNGVGASPDTHGRTSLHERCIARGFRFVSVVHAASVVSGRAQLGDGVQVMAGAVIQAGAQLGANTVVNTSASVDHDCRLGANVFLAPRATLCGGVVVDDGAFIGAGVIICPGVRIGKKAIVGAGAVVRHDIPHATLYVGNPARKVRGV